RSGGADGPRAEARAARTDLGRYREVDVGEQAHGERAARRDLAGLHVELAGRRSVVSVDDADGHGLRDERQRWAESQAVDAVRARRRDRVGDGIRGRVAARETERERGSLREDEVVRGSAPADVEIGAGRPGQECDLVGSAIRVPLTSVLRYPAQAAPAGLAFQDNAVDVPPPPSSGSGDDLQNPGSDPPTDELRSNRDLCRISTPVACRQRKRRPLRHALDTDAPQLCRRASRNIRLVRAERHPEVAGAVTKGILVAAWIAVVADHAIRSPGRPRHVKLDAAVGLLPPSPRNGTGPAGTDGVERERADEQPPGSGPAHRLGITATTPRDR